MHEAIVVIQYKELEFLPPVMALLEVLQRIGHMVVYVGVASPAGERFLKGLGIEYHFMPYNASLYRNNSFVTKITHRLQRVAGFQSRRVWVNQCIRALQSRFGDIILWCSEVQSAALLGRDALRYARRIVSIYELSDFYGKAWLGFPFLEFLAGSTVVVPEENRAVILEQCLGLLKRPLVLPNKPATHPRTTNLPVESLQFTELMKHVGSRPIFLYQGVWTPDRSFVSVLIETLCRERPDYCVLSMPGGEAVETLKAKYPNVFSHHYIPPPNHLAVTSHATVGIAVYNSSGTTLLERLNAQYCAPNKVYEYSGFGIPILGNDVPGLRYTIGQSGAGRCCELQPESVLEAADDLVNRHAEYRQRATQFFDSVSLDEIVEMILKEAMS